MVKRTARKPPARKRKFVPTGFVEIETEMAEKIYWISRVKHRTESQILERLLRNGLRKLFRGPPPGQDFPFAIRASR